MFRKCHRKIIVKYSVKGERIKRITMYDTYVSLIHKNMDDYTRFVYYVMNVIKTRESLTFRIPVSP